MKEIIFSVNQQKREMFFLTMSLTLAIILNIIGTLAYETPLSEFFTEWPHVLLITGVVYAIVIRVIMYLVQSIVNK